MADAFKRKLKPMADWPPAQRVPAARVPYTRPAIQQAARAKGTKNHGPAR